MSIATTVSLDCLLSNNGAIPRSVSRSLLSLLLPFSVLAIATGYWTWINCDNPIVLKRRLTMSAVVVLYISFSSLVEEMLSAISCVDVNNGETIDLYWTSDTSVKCFQGSHGILVFALVIPMILCILFAFPIGSAIYLYLKRRAGKLEDSEVKERFGFMYGAYTDECVFWDCVVMLRKAALAAIVVFGASLVSNLQNISAVCVLFFSLYLQTRFLPFHEDFKDFNSLEIHSLLVSSFTFTFALYMNDPNVTGGGRHFITVFVAAMILTFVFRLLVNLYFKVVAYCEIELQLKGQTIYASQGIGIFIQWVQFRWLRAAKRLKNAAM